MREIDEILRITADKKKKLDYLRSRPENQKPGRAHMLDTIDRVIEERHDTIIPWVFREMTRGRLPTSLLQMSGAPGEAGRYITERNITWEDFFVHVADWFEAKRPDLMRLTTGDVAEELRDWDDELAEAQELAKKEQYEEHEVVHDFGDGWTIQRVHTAHDLELEGDKMGHCVGSYCGNVAQGTSFIYSLRDPKNEPHATIELDKDHTDKKAHSVQIQGKGNAAPIPEYADRVRDWMESAGLAAIKTSQIARQLGLGNIYDSYNYDDDEAFFSDPRSSLQDWVEHLREEEPENLLFQDFDAVLNQYARQAVGQHTSAFIEYLDDIDDFNQIVPTIGEVGYFSDQRIRLSLNDLKKSWENWIDYAEVPGGLTAIKAFENWLEDDFGVTIDKSGYVSGNIRDILNGEIDADDFYNSSALSDMDQEREARVFENARDARQEVLWALAMICDPQGPVAQSFVDKMAGEYQQVTIPNPNQLELPFNARQAFAELLGLCSVGT